MLEKYEIEILNKDGTIDFLLLRRFKKEDAPRLFKSWSNPQNYRFNEIPLGVKKLEDGTVKSGVELIEEIAERDFPDIDGQYFFVIEHNGEIVGNCRFGCCKNWNSKFSNRDDVWDFGYNIVRSDDKDSYTLQDINNAFKPNGIISDTKYWGKGYISAVIGFIINKAKEMGITIVTSGADVLNYGSIKPMLKNGMKFAYIIVIIKP